MNIDPLVSILVPAYNHEAFVQVCLDSIRVAACCPVELLVLDDGSSDRTYQVVDRWIKENQQLFTRCHLEKRNRFGVTKNLNYLCSLAKGKYILWIASDDILQPNAISGRLPLFDESDVDVVIGDATIIDAEGKVLSDSAMRDSHHANVDRLTERSRITSVLLKKWYVPGPCLMFRRTMLDTVGELDESLMAEDRDFFLRILAKPRTAYVNYPVAGYRKHGTNTSTSSPFMSRVRLDVYWSNWHNAGLYRGLPGIYLSTYRFDWWMLRLFAKFPKAAFYASAPSILLRYLLGIFF